MATKPRKKEPTLAELLAQYGRNIASDVPVVGRRIVEDVRSLPEMAAAGNRAMLGATQRISDMLPPVLQMPGVRGDYRPSIDEVTGLARDIGVGGNRLVTGTSQRGLDAMGAPRGAGYDLPATEMSRMAQDAIVSGVQALPRQAYDSPLSTAYEAAMMAAPVPGRVMRGAKALGKAVRGSRRAAPLAAAVEDVAAAPSLAAKYDVAAPLSIEPRLAARAAPQGLIAYHGSPHRFDRFDMSKLGTGEGAQSYGHGLYFAENEDVAKAYRDTFAKTAGARATSDGKTVGDLVLTDPVAAKALAQVENFGGVAEAIARLKRMGGSPAAIRWLEERGGAVDVVPNASMYQVRIDADPADFLDYDAPLSGQSARVRDAVLSQPEVVRAIAAQSRILPDIADKMSGAGAYSALTGWKRGADLSPLTASAANITQRMAGVGLPGIKYFDQGSRATGGGSRNFVVFDDALVNILKRYAVGGAVSGGSH
jgi:hypothetical protein